MTSDLTVLCGTAALVGVAHTLLGPDHYIPFAVMARTRSWSPRRTAMITLLCGVGHILGSVVLGAIGIAVGLTLFTIESIQTVRGELAGWLLVFFGLVYTVWGVKRAVRRSPHQHVHVHEDGTIHNHNHTHETDHIHVHDQAASEDTSKHPPRSLAPWALFVIFLFGPCEALIPFLMYPAAKGRLMDAFIVAAVFGLATLATMIISVLALVAGFRFFPTSRLERYGHMLAGIAILVCGVAVKVGL